MFHFVLLCCVFFFFKQKTAYEMRISDWSSDVCSSDLAGLLGPGIRANGPWRAASLLPLIEAGADIHRKLRARLRQILAEGAAERTLIEPHLHPLGSLDMCVPLSPPDFADFYASYHHALRSAAAMRREPVEGGTANWKATALGYPDRSGDR